MVVWFLTETREELRYINTPPAFCGSWHISPTHLLVRARGIYRLSVDAISIRSCAIFEYILCAIIGRNRQIMDPSAWLFLAAIVAAFIVIVTLTQRYFSSKQKKSKFVNHTFLILFHMFVGEHQIEIPCFHFPLLHFPLL